MSVAKYRKRPVTIEAVQWNGDNFEEVMAFAGTNVKYDPKLGINNIQILTMANGWVPSPAGEWVLKGVSGEFYPCAKAVFDATYDKVE